MFTKKCKFSNRKRNCWFNCDCFNHQCHSSVTLGRKDHYMNEWETFNTHLHFSKEIKTFNYCVLSCESNMKYLTTGGKILFVSLKALSQSMIIFFTLNWIFLNGIRTCWTWSPQGFSVFSIKFLLKMEDQV